jgi:hypothetical protein
MPFGKNYACKKMVFKKENTTGCALYDITTLYIVAFRFLSIEIGKHIFKKILHESV